MSDICRHCRSNARWEAFQADPRWRPMVDRRCYSEYYMGSGYWAPDGIHHDINCRAFLSVQDYGREEALRRRGSALLPPPTEADIQTAQHVVARARRRFLPGHCVECDEDLRQRADDPRAPVTRDLCQSCRQGLWIPSDVVQYGVPVGTRVWVRGGKSGVRRILRVVPGIVYGGTGVKIRITLYTAWPENGRATRNREYDKDEPRFYTRPSVVAQDL